MNRSFSVSKEEYMEILGFTTYAFLTGKITKYSGIIGGQRALGEYIENFIYGKVAEIAFRKFLEEDLRIEALTDADLADFILGIYLPDLVAFKNKIGQWDVLRFWTDVKEVRREQKWLLVPKVSSSASPRLYDAYVAVWVGLPDDHLYWVISQMEDVRKNLGQDWMEKAEEIADSVSNIQCKIKGFALWSDVQKMIDAVEKGDSNAEDYLDSTFGEGRWHLFNGREALYDPEDPSWKGSQVRENYGFYLNSLRNDWSAFTNHITRNMRLVPDLGLNRVSVPDQYEQLKERYRERYRTGDVNHDFRSLYQKILEDQIAKIQQAFGDLKRKISWFQQPL